MTGAPGGSPFQACRTGRAPCTGFHYTFGRWSGKQVIRTLDPVFPGAPAPPNDAAQTFSVMARDGYVVTGLNVDVDDSVRAIQVVFTRGNINQIDAASQYTSDWIGIQTGNKVTRLSGNGEFAVGIYGRRGLTLYVVGLLLSKPGGK